MEKKDNLIVGLQVCFYRLCLSVFFYDPDFIPLVWSFTTYVFGSNIFAPLKTKHGDRQQSCSQHENKPLSRLTDQSSSQLVNPFVSQSACQLAN